MGIQVSTRGPVFDDGLRRQVVGEALQQASDDVAQYGHDLLRAQFRAAFRHPTGRYASRVVVDRAAAGRLVITDHHVVYGPWLEGTSSRNKTTRFKGYRSFRIVAQELARRVPQLAEARLDKALGRLR